jgi:hypothetical protein
MLKISPEKIAKPFLIIFNKSLQQSKYPSNWKSAHVIAKTFMPNHVESFRKIAKDEAAKFFFF